MAQWLAHNLTLSQKAMLLISLPLAFELVFVSCLFYFLHQAEMQAQKAELAKDILATSTRLTDSYISAGKILFQYSVIGEASYMDKYDACKASILKDFARLKKSLRNDPKTLRVISNLEKTSDLALAHLDEARRSMEMGESGAAKTTMETVKTIADELWSSVNTALLDYRRIEKNSPRYEIENKTLFKRLLLAGVVLNIVLAIGLAKYFNKGTTSRLSVLMNNTSRLKSGTELNPALAGADEIAELDRVFHMMAQSLTEASEGLKRSEARIRAVIDGLPIGVFVLNDEGKILYCNARAASLFLVSQESVTEQSLLNLITDTNGKTIASFAQILEKCLGHPKEFAGKKSDGSKLPLELSLTEFVGGGYLLGLQDISERHRMEQMKQEFLSMISHDLRTPLTSIQLTLELLAMGRYGELGQEGVAKVRKDEANCQRLLGLVNDLLDIDRLESGKMELELHLVLLSDVFEKSAAAVASFADKSKVQISMNASKLELICDPARTIQVLVNLLSNAIKFSPSESLVELSGVPHPDSIEIRVTDHGRGVPEALKKSIFERFEQVKRDDAIKHGGSGLGLAICKLIVESHGGTIGVESEEGKGSTFWFKLPLLQDEDDADGDDDEAA